MDRPKGGRRAGNFEEAGVRVRKSRVLLLAAVAGLAAALSLGAVLVPQSAEANRVPPRKVQAAKRAQAVKRARRLAYVAEVRRTLTGIRAERDETWRWQDVMSASHVRYGAYAERSHNLRYAKSVLALWTRRAWQVRRQAQHPPRLQDWMCIHRYEGSWTDPNAPYYGGLQMDVGFMQAYGGALFRRKGTADHWTPLEQIWVAERAYRSGRGFYPWPNTARWCGLI
jgi:hypothetical protein